MIKHLRFILLIVPVMFFLPSHVFGQDQAVYGERIDSMKVEVVINSDATANIKEEIYYNFDTLFRHGIYRNIPVKYKTQSGNNFKFNLSNISVVNEFGNPYPFSVSNDGKYKVIKIGDPEKEISGVHEYVISYSVDQPIGYFDDFDEIYWNATGNEWLVPILSTEAIVTLPRQIFNSDLRIACYQGFFSSTETCPSQIRQIGDKTKIYFQSNRPFNVGEGLTFAVGFPKGIVYEPTPSERFKKSFFEAGWYWLFLPILVFLFMYVIWYKHGRDPKGTGVVIPEYEAPENLSPMQIRFLLGRSFGNSLSAEIIFLATRGYLRINKIPKDDFFSHEDYEFEMLKPADQNLKPFQAELLESIFSFDPTSLYKKNLQKLFSKFTNGKEEDESQKLKQKVQLSDFKNKFYITAQKIENNCSASLIESGYYYRAKDSSNGFSGEALGKKVSRVIAGTIGIIFALFLVTPALWFNFGFIAALSFFISIIITIIFLLLMPKVTKHGAIVKEKIKGFKLYLSVAEKDRINFHNAPEKIPEQFEEFLPFAMALGVEKEWAKVFEGMILPPPNWYNDSSISSFNSSAFMTSIASFSSASRSSLSSAPGSSSGSGGGGSSGGGGGGGGGGSW